MDGPKRLARETIYRSHWVNLFVDKVQFPDSHVIDRHHLLDFEDPSVVAVMERGNEQVLFARIYRYTVETTGWEIPAGRIEQGESILAAAQREILEESGWESTHHELIYSYNPMNGIANKTMHIVRCRAEKRITDFDTNEVSDIRWFTWKEVQRMIERSEITDGATLVALLICMLHRVS